MVDSDKKKVIVHRFEGEDYLPEVYGFEDEVPLGIFDGECKIDFKAIYERIKFIYEK